MSGRTNKSDKSPNKRSKGVCKACAIKSHDRLTHFLQAFTNKEEYDKLMNDDSDDIRPVDNITTIKKRSKNLKYTEIDCKSAYEQRNIDNEFFSYDLGGFINQYSINDQDLVYEWGQLVCAKNLQDSNFFNKNYIDLSSDGKFLFVCDENFNQCQWDISTKRMAKNYGLIHDGLDFSILTTKNSQYLFSYDTKGHLKQFDQSKRKLYKDYGKVHKGAIHSLALTPDDKYQFTSDGSGYLKQWSVTHHQLSKDYGKIHDKGIQAILMTSDGLFLFTGDDSGNLKQFDLEKQVLLKNFGRVHNAAITSLAQSCNGLYFYSADFYGKIKEWSIYESKLTKVVIFLNKNTRFCVKMRG